MDFVAVSFVLGLMGMVGGLFVLAILLIRYQASRAPETGNYLDYKQSQVLASELAALVLHLSQSSSADDAPSGTHVYRNLRLGEITRHFDSQTRGSVEGWLEHSLALSGFGVAGSVGRMGLGVGSYGITGDSRVGLTYTGTTRDALLGEGFVAVFEQDAPCGGIDTLRLVVPSEAAAREHLGHLLAAHGSAFGEGSYRAAVLRRAAPTFQRAFTTDASYVSDRLSALLRMPAESRPQTAVAGVEIATHAVLGAAVQFQEHDAWHALFPVSLPPDITAALVRAGAPAISSATDG